MKNIIPVEYNLMICFIRDRLKVNSNNESIKRKLELLLNDVMALSQIDLEEHNAIRHFVDDYE
jgi:hypothetical protein